MFKAIIIDVLFKLILCVIIAAGTLFCIKTNTIAVEQEIYDNWTYNTDVKIPNGFSKAMYSPPKKGQ